MKPIDVLKGMRALFTGPETHARHAFTRDKQGNARSATHSEACSWCVWGALFRVTPGEECNSVRGPAMDAIRDAAGRESLEHWSDSATFEELTGALDRAIATVEK